MQKSRLWILITVVIVLLGSLFYWLSPNQDPNKTDQSNLQTQTMSQSNSEMITPIQNGNGTSPWASKSQQDTQINCQLRLNKQSKLIVDTQTKDCFEYFITQYGEKELSQIKADFKHYIEQNYQEPAISQILNLWDRYLQYRERLGQIQQPTESQQNTSYYRKIFQSMHSIRQTLFSTYEIEGLFGTEDTYNEYTIKRMEVTDNKNLTEIEKAKKLKELFDELPEDWKENLEQINKLQDLTKLTDDIKARGGSENEIRQMRLNLVGPEATSRLEKLDVQNQQWKSKVNTYLNERDTVLQSNMSESAKQQAIQQIKEKHFNAKQEQLRVSTFEAAHDQGQTLPFFD